MKMLTALIEEKLVVTSVNKTLSVI